MNPDEWKNDPRLAGMDPVKLQYIEKSRHRFRPRNPNLLPALLSLQADARKNVSPSLTRKQLS